MILLFVFVSFVLLRGKLLQYNGKVHSLLVYSCVIDSRVSDNRVIDDNGRGHCASPSSAEESQQLRLDVVERIVDESAVAEEQVLGSFLGVLGEGLSVCQPEYGPPIRSPSGARAWYGFMLGGPSGVGIHHERADKVRILPGLLDLSGHHLHHLLVDNAIGSGFVELKGNSVFGGVY